MASRRVLSRSVVSRRVVSGCVIWCGVHVLRRGGSPCLGGHVVDLCIRHRAAVSGGDDSSSGGHDSRPSYQPAPGVGDPPAPCARTSIRSSASRARSRNVPTQRAPRHNDSTAKASGPSRPCQLTRKVRSPPRASVKTSPWSGSTVTSDDMARSCRGVLPPNSRNDLVKRVCPGLAGPSRPASGTSDGPPTVVGSSPVGSIASERWRQPPGPCALGT